MAATVVSTKILKAGADGEAITEVKLSALTSGLPEQVSHSGPSGVAPFSVQLVLTAPPTDGSMVSFIWDDSDTTNNKVEFRALCPAGGSLDGATATLICRFLGQASAGQSTITTT